MFYLTDEENHDRCENEKTEPVKCVEAVVHVHHVSVDAVPGRTALGDDAHKLLDANIRTVVLVENLEDRDGLIPAMWTKNFNDVVCREPLVAFCDKRQPNASCQRRGRSRVGPSTLNNRIRACRSKPVSVGLVRDEITEEARCLVTVKSEASKIARNTDATRRMLVAFSISDKLILFQESAPVWRTNVDGSIVESDESVLKIFGATELDVIASIVIVDCEVGNQELLDQVKRDPKSRLLQNVGENIVPPESVRWLVDVDSKKFVLTNALRMKGISILEHRWASTVDMTYGSKEDVSDDRSSEEGDWSSHQLHDSPISLVSRVCISSTL